MGGSTAPTNLAVHTLRLPFSWLLAQEGESLDYATFSFCQLVKVKVPGAGAQKQGNLIVYQLSASLSILFWMAMLRKGEGACPLLGAL